VVLQLDLFQEGGLPRDVKVMGPGLHTGFHHSLPVESNKKDRIGNGSFLMEINTVPRVQYLYQILFRVLNGFKFQQNVQCSW
jgi:hypothetical protein